MNLLLYHFLMVTILVFPSSCFGWNTTPKPGMMKQKPQQQYSVVAKANGVTIRTFTQQYASLENRENVDIDDNTSNQSTTSGSNNQREDTQKMTKSKSPWGNARWKITFDFGREPGSWMPEEWGKEGGRLVLSPIEVEITCDRPSGYPKKEDPMLETNAWKLQPITKVAKYITMKGQQEAKFGDEGGWKIRMPWGGTSAGTSSSTIAKRQGHASKIMCYVDLLSDISKGDVKISKGERLYMTGKCWREDDLENALKTMYPIRNRFLEAQARLEAQLEHETGDRRLDGTDPLQTLMGMKDVAQLVLQRDEAQREYEDAKVLYPSFDDTTKEYSVDDIPLEEGPWPGQVEWLSIEPGYLLLRRSKFLNEEYHVVGKWKAEPVFGADDDDSSYTRSSIF